jgi:hypothetical protein
MIPVSPVVPGMDLQKFEVDGHTLKEVVLGADQPQYQPLPALLGGGTKCQVITRWKMGWRERVRLLLTGNLWIVVMTFGMPYPPMLVDTQSPKDTIWKGVTSKN